MPRAHRRGLALAAPPLPPIERDRRPVRQRALSDHRADGAHLSPVAAGSRGARHAAAVALPAGPRWLLRCHVALPLAGRAAATLRRHSPHRGICGLLRGPPHRQPLRAHHRSPSPRDALARTPMPPQHRTITSHRHITPLHHRHTTTPCRACVQSWPIRCHHYTPLHTATSPRAVVANSMPPLHPATSPRAVVANSMPPLHPVTSPRVVVAN